MSVLLAGLPTSIEFQSVYSAVVERPFVIGRSLHFNTMRVLVVYFAALFGIEEVSQRSIQAGAARRRKEAAKGNEAVTFRFLPAPPDSRVRLRRRTIL